MIDSKSPVFGVVIDWFLGGYQKELVTGIENEANSREIRVIYFPGRIFEPFRDYELHFDRIYELLDENYLDGLIIPTLVMGGVKNENCFEYIKKLISLPVITLGFEAGDFPSVLIDNEGGFRDLLNHLILEHRFRKLAFIHGTREHPDAVSRFKVYKEALKANKIDYDEKKIFYGRFWTHSGVEAVKAFLDERKLILKEDIEVIIASNDLIASGVIKELESRGIMVPGDVAVTGFDDSEEGRNRIIPITTVRQPIMELGREAVKALALKEKSKTHLSSLCLPRGTCGCPLSIRRYEIKAAPGEAQDLRRFLIDGIRGIILIRDGGGTSFPEKLVDIFMQPLSTWDLKRIKLVLYNLLTAEVHINGDLNSWHDAFSFLERHLPRTGKYSEERRELFEFTYLLTADLFQRIEIQKRVESEVYSEHLRAVNVYINPSLDINEISQYLARELPRVLKIKICYLFLYDKAGNYSRDFRLLKKKDAGYTGIASRYYKDFAAIAKDLLFPGSSSSNVVMPLLSGGKSMGFFVMDFNPEAWYAYENLRAHVGAILNNSFILMESENRHRNLKELQQKLVQSAHQAGMAQIIINLMHTIGNILNSAYVSLDNLQNMLKKGIFKRFLKANDLLKQHLDNPGKFFNDDPRGKLLPQYYLELGRQMKKENTKMTENTVVLEEIINRITSVIDSQDKLANGLFIFEPVNLVECLEDSLLLKHHILETSNVRLIKNYNLSDKFMIACFQNKLLHILVKLLESAVNRAVAGPGDNRIITISLEKVRNKILLQIANTGMGIRKSNLTRIFSQDYEDQYISANSELHLIANSLYEIGASIRAESGGENSGAVFVVTFIIRT